MATAYSIKLKMGTMNGVKTWTYKYANPNVTQDRINSLMDTMIANGAIFKYPPLTKESAKLVATEETEFSLS